MQMIMPQLKQKNPQMYQQISDLIQTAKSGNTKEVEEYARKVFKDNGRDFDKEFAQFMSSFK